MKRRQFFLSLAFLVISCAPASAVPMLTVLGDSMSAGTGGGWFPNWHTQLNSSRGVTRTNFASGGDVAADVLNTQLPAAMPGIDPGDYVVVIIGGNDAVAAANAYVGGGDPMVALNSAVADISATVLQLKAAGAKPILANIPDVTRTPVAQTLGTPAQRAFVSAAIATANDSLHTFLQNQLVPYGDLDQFIRDRGAPSTTFTLGATSLTYANRYYTDGFHPESEFQGLMGNLVLKILNDYYGDPVAPLTDQEILVNSGRPATGATSYFNVAPYVILPVPEPNTVVLAAIGGAALAGVGIKRRKTRRIAG